MHKDIITAEFLQSLHDYAYLLNQGYPRKTILKIVGDRYLLNTFQRILLSRGVFPDDAVESRIKNTIESITGREIHIDTYNVLFTISNYLLGRIVFISNDLFLRDAGEVFGKLHKDPVFPRSIDLLAGYLSKMKAGHVEFHIDRPVSYSAELAGSLRKSLSRSGLSGNASLEKNPDTMLIRLDRGIVATSDSDVLDETAMPVTDLAHMVLKDRFSLKLPDLGRLLSPESDAAGSSS
jgi:hypothetical protein